MKYHFGNEVSYDIIKLTSAYYHLLSNFDCGHEGINNYFREKCKSDVEVVTYLFIDTSNKSLLGCASIQCSGIRFEVDNYVKTIPAIEIKYFAVINECQKLLYEPDDKHYYFSDDLLGSLISKCYDISENIIGAEYIILYSLPDKVSFYDRSKFENYSKFMKRDMIQETKDCKPMFLKL